MAIEKGITIGCTDLQRTGGISHICLRTIATGDAVTVDTTADTHAYSSIVDTGGSTATWYLYEFKNETPVMSVAATKENGSTVFECSLSFYLPNMTSAKLHELQSLLDTCMAAVVVDTNGNKYVLGISEKYKNEEAHPFRDQTYLNLSGMEGSTGAAYSEENGITVTLMARQFELPRLYSGTLTIGSSAGQATTN